MTAFANGVGVKAHVADIFEADDLGAPFKVNLHNAVEVTRDFKTGEVLSYKIPSFEGLLAAIVMERVVHPLKLRGADMKFIRKVLGMKQKEFADKIEVSVEHFSRCETGSLPLSPSSEKLFRIFSFKTAMKLHRMKACEDKVRLESILDTIFDELALEPFAKAGEDLCFDFCLSRRRDDAEPSDDGGHWEAEHGKAA